jgi:integrase
MLAANLRAGDDWLRRKGQQQGSVQRRGDEWHIFFRQLVADELGNATWKQTSRAVGPAVGPERLTKRQALAKGQQDHVHRANGLTLTPGGAATLEQFIDAKYRPDHIAQLQASADYESIIRCHLLPSLGHCQLRDINRAMCQALISEKVKAGLSSQRVTHVRNILSSIFRHARRLNYVAGELPTADLILPKMRRTERQPLSETQIAAVLQFLPESRLRVAFRLMCAVGLRAGEMAGLRWCCVNLGDAPILAGNDWVMPRCLLVREQYRRNEWAELKTVHSRRTVPLVDELVELLTEWKAAAKRTGEADPVFAGRNGSPMDHHNELSRRLKPACVKAGVPWASWHSARHTASTQADRVMSQSEKMALLGHTTARASAGYTHVQADTMRERLEEMTAKGRVS